MKVRARGRKFSAAQMPPGAPAGVRSRKGVGVHWFKIWPKTARVTWITQPRWISKTQSRYFRPFLALPPPHQHPPQYIKVLFRLYSSCSRQPLYFICRILPTLGPNCVLFGPLEKIKNVVFISVCFYFIFIQPLTSSICFCSAGFSPPGHIHPPLLSLKTQS